jgi:hypothetical protein
LGSKSKIALEKFISLFQRNLFLEEIVVSETTGHFIHHDCMLKLHHYCARNIFLRKLLRPQERDNPKLYIPIYDPFSGCQLSDETRHVPKIRSTKSIHQKKIFW